MTEATTIARKAPRMSGSVTILTLLAMVACFAPGAETDARRDARVTRVLACHYAMGVRLVVVSETVGVPVPIRRVATIAIGAPAPVAPIAHPADPPLRESLLDLPPPTC